MIMSPVLRPVAPELLRDIGVNEVFTAVGVSHTEPYSAHIPSLTLLWTPKLSSDQQGWMIYVTCIAPHRP